MTLRTTARPDLAAEAKIGEAADSHTPALLCVANFPTNTGFAWDFIERLYVETAARLARQGVRTFVAYPEIREPPRSLAGTGVQPAQLRWDLESFAGLREVLRFVRRHRVHLLYLTDRTAWHPAYALLRLAGVRWIVVHDHTSGKRVRPTGLKRRLKWLRMRIPWVRADRAIGVSDFVAERLREVALVPPGRVRRIWNWVDIPQPDAAAPRRLRETFGIPPERPVVACTCRAVPEKGVHHLLRAFDGMLSGTRGQISPVLVYFGGGPMMDELRALREALPSREQIILAGYRPDARRLAAGADLCVVPSIWEEAFGLSVLEPMASGVPVVASRVGGIPEVVVEGTTGLLVSPGDESELAAAMEKLLTDAGLRRRLGANAREHATRKFSGDEQIAALTELLQQGLGSAPAAGTDLQIDPG